MIDDINEIKETFEFGAPVITVYGAPGIGKSSFGTLFPKPIFLDAEHRLRNIRCKKIAVNSFQDVIGSISSLCSQDHEYETVVIDTLGAVESLIHAQVCLERGVDNIQQIDFWKGFYFALNFWHQLREGLQYLRDEKNMCILLIGHSEIETYTSPLSESFDRNTLRLDKRARSVITDWSDYILFAEEKVLTSVSKEGFKKTSRALEKGTQRILRTYHPGCVSKRSLDIPNELPLDREVNYFLDEVAKAQQQLLTHEA